MPFEPKLIGDNLIDDPIDDDLSYCEDEFALPDDLQELAGQLGEDAERLAACYPSAADSSSHDGVHPGARQTAWVRWRRVAVAAVVVLACGAWSAAELARESVSGGNTLEESFSDNSIPSSLTSEIAHDGSGLAGLPYPDLSYPGHVTFADIGLLDALDVGDSFGSDSNAECADFFQDLSAPEQEALLDLLENESQEVRDLPL